MEKGKPRTLIEMPYVIPCCCLFVSIYLTIFKVKELFGSFMNQQWTHQINFQTKSEPIGSILSILNRTTAKPPT